MAFKLNDIKTKRSPKLSEEDLEDTQAIIPPPTAQTINDQALRGAIRKKGVLRNTNDPVSLPSGKVVQFDLKNIPVSRCRIFKGNPRAQTMLTEQDLQDILPSIKNGGVKEHVMARPVADEDGISFEIIDGSRRFKAASLTQLEFIPAKVGEIDDLDAYYLSHIANIYDAPSAYEVGLFLLNESRDPLSPFKSADELMAHQQIAKATYYRYLAVADLPSYVIECFESPKMISVRGGADLCADIKSFLTGSSKGKGDVNGERELALKKFCESNRWDSLNASAVIQRIKAWIEKQGRELQPKSKNKAPRLMDGMLIGRSKTFSNKQGVDVLKVIKTAANTLKFEILEENESKQEKLLQAIAKQLQCEI